MKNPVRAGIDLAERLNVRGRTIFRWLFPDIIYLTLHKVIALILTGILFIDKSLKKRS